MPTRLRSSSRVWLIVALAAAIVGVLGTLGVQAITRSGEIEVRINAQRESDGDVIFALQQRDASGSWGERQMPRAHRLPAAFVGRWANSTPVTVTWEVEIETDEKVVAVVTQIEEIGGVEVEVDRYMEVETVPTVTEEQSDTGADDELMDSGGPVADYASFCHSPDTIQPGGYIDGQPSRTLVRALWEARNSELTTTEWLRLLDLELTVWTSVTPPPSFALFHSAMVAGLQSVRAAYAQRDAGEIVFSLGPNPRFFLDEPRRTEWSSGFPADVIQLLKVNGCIAAPELEGGLMGG